MTLRDGKENEKKIIKSMILHCIDRLGCVGREVFSVADVEEELVYIFDCHYSLQKISAYLHYLIKDGILGTTISEENTRKYFKKKDNNFFEIEYIVA